MSQNKLMFHDVNIINSLCSAANEGSIYVSLSLAVLSEVARSLEEAQPALLVSILLEIKL